MKSKETNKTLKSEYKFNLNTSSSLFLSGWSLNANLWYAFLISCGDAVASTPRTYNEEGLVRLHIQQFTTATV